MMPEFLRSQRGKDLFFIALLIGCFFTFRYEYLLRLGANGLHVWRQSDCLSLAQNYYNGKATFFEPEMHFQMSDNGTSGKVAGEFPGLYYFISMVWSTFGKSYGSWRIVSILLTFLGVFALYRSFLLLSGNVFWSMVWPLMVLSTPVISEYGSSFLTDVPAFSFALMAWYFFLRFYRDDSDRMLAFAMVLFCLAGLLKISALILCLASLGLLPLELLGVRFGGSGQLIFRRKWKQLGIILLGFLPIVAWYLYARHFTELHGGKYTFNHIWPVWELSSTKITEMIGLFWQRISPWVLSLPTWYVLPGLILVWPFMLQRGNRLAWGISLLTLLGVVSYLALWFQSIDAHDYYFANAMVLFALAPLPWMTYQKTMLPWQSSTLRFLGLLLLCFNLVYARQHLELRHYPQEHFGYCLMPAEQVSVMKYIVWEQDSRTKALLQMEPMFEELGITHDTKVVIMPDITINNTLYLIDRPGWTEFWRQDRFHVMHHANAAGAEFLLVLVRGDIYGSPGMGDYQEFVVASYENVDVVDLKAYRAAHP